MKPPPPAPAELPDDWPHRPVHARVTEAIRALPVHFKSQTVIEGLHASDLQTLNGPLGATIEDQVVQTLNDQRRVWDPEDLYPRYRFFRQPQTFPDVRLQCDTAAGPDIVMGIELKGWFLLAKEREPNFRFTTTPGACAAADLLVVVPWALSNVVSGTPRVFAPFILGCRYAGEHRNHWWSHVRDSKGDDPSVVVAEGAAPYPRKKDRVSDRAAKDAGGNFGRIARTGLMDEYCAEMRRLLLLGVAVSDWLDFFDRAARSVEAGQASR